MKNKTNITTHSLKVFTIASSFFLTAFVGFFPLKTQAFSPSSTSSYSIQSTDTIVYKFRTHNGKRQYRRWNETKACWVDPDWIDLN